MKKGLFKILSCALIVLAATLTSCSNDDNTNIFGYEFPETQSLTLAIGQQSSFTFKSDGPWNLYTESLWVKFVEDDDYVYSKSGVAGEYTISYIVTDANWGFGDKEATVILSMNGQTSTIANITRTGKEPIVTVYQTNFDTFEDIEVSTVNLDWSDRAFKYQARLKFSTNFDWKLEGMPQWVANNDTDYYMTEGKAGESAYFYFTNDYTYYTLEDMEVEVRIVGKNDPSISFPLTIKAEGAQNIFIAPEMLKYQGLVFEANGKTTAVNGTEIDEYNFNLTGVSGGYNIRAINTEIGYSGDKFYGVDYGYGLAFDSDWIEAMGMGINRLGEFVWDYSYSVGAFANSGAERTATLFAIPADVLRDELNYNVENMFTQSGKLKAAYERYVLGDITQKSGDGNGDNKGLQFVYPDYAQMYGATLEKTTNQDLTGFYQDEWGVSPENVYILTYDNPNSGLMSQITWLQGGEPFFEIADENKEWLNASNGDSYFSVSMRPENPAPSDWFEGGIVITVNGQPQYAIHCILLNNKAE